MRRNHAKEYSELHLIIGEIDFLTFDNQKIDTARFSLFKRIHDDFLCEYCGIVQTFINKETFLNYLNDTSIGTEKIIDPIITPFEKEINQLFKSIDLLLDEALDGTLSFKEVSNKRVALKAFSKDFIKTNQIIRTIKEISNEINFIQEIFLKIIKNMILLEGILINIVIEFII